MSHNNNKLNNSLSNFSNKRSSQSNLPPHTASALTVTNNNSSLSLIKSNNVSSNLTSSNRSQASSLLSKRKQNDLAPSNRTKKYGRNQYNISSLNVTDSDFVSESSRINSHIPPSNQINEQKSNNNSHYDDRQSDSELSEEIIINDPTSEYEDFIMINEEESDNNIESANTMNNSLGEVEEEAEEKEITKVPKGRPPGKKNKPKDKALFESNYCSAVRGIQRIPPNLIAISFIILNLHEKKILYIF